MAAKVVLKYEGNEAVEKLITDLTEKKSRAKERVAFLKKQFISLMEEAEEANKQFWREVEVELDKINAFPGEKATDYVLTVDEEVKCIRTEGKLKDRKPSLSDILPGILKHLMD